MSKLLDKSLKRLKVYAGLVLICSIPVYYLTISRLWEYELDEHKIALTPEAGREDSFLIIATVTLLTLFFFILLLGGFILINRNISQRLWRPFYQTLHRIKDFDLNKQQHIVFDTTNIDEFAELNNSIHKLISSSVSVYNQQKEFADNASHELQTPLAIVQSKLDILLQSKSLTGEQYNIIEDALKALARVARINKNLLLLTKIENSHFIEKEIINLSDLLNNTLSLFQGFAESKQLNVQKHMPLDVTVVGNRILVEILLNNLITNAIRHSACNDTVLINLSENNLVIANTGTSSLRQEYLFERFGTVSSQTPGTGLGLSLVKQICNRYNWQIHYSFENSLHIFSLSF